MRAQILPSDQVYQMDYASVVQFHRENLAVGILAMRKWMGRFLVFCMNTQPRRHFVAWQAFDMPDDSRVTLVDCLDAVKELAGVSSVQDLTIVCKAVPEKVVSSVGCIKVREIFIGALSPRIESRFFC
jgi:hypothetical protein